MKGTVTNTQKEQAFALLDALYDSPCTNDWGGKLYLHTRIAMTVDCSMSAARELHTAWVEYRAEAVAAKREGVKTA